MMRKKTLQRSWGCEMWITCNEFYAVRWIQINNGQLVSLEYDKEKTVTLYVLDGKAKHTVSSLYVDSEVNTIKTGDVISHIPMQTHEIAALENTTIIEVFTPSIPDQDFIRLHNKLR